MSTFAERLGQAIKARGIKKNALERQAGLSGGYVSRLTKGGRLEVGQGRMERIARVLNVSYEWLSTGKGKMEIERTVSLDPRFSDEVKDGIAIARIKYKSHGLAALQDAIDANVGPFAKPTTDSDEVVRKIGETLNAAKKAEAKFGAAEERGARISARVDDLEDEMDSPTGRKAKFRSESLVSPPESLSSPPSKPVPSKGGPKKKK